MDCYPDYTPKYSVQIPKPELTADMKHVAELNTSEGSITVYYLEKTEQVLLEINKTTWYIQPDSPVDDSLKAIFKKWPHIQDDELYVKNIITEEKTKVRSYRMIDDFTECWWSQQSRWSRKEYIYEATMRFGKPLDVSENPEICPEPFSVNIPKPPSVPPKIAEVETPKGKINVYMDLEKKNVLLEVNEKEWFYQNDDYTAESIAKVLEVPLTNLSATDGFLGKYWSSFKEPVKAIVEF
jgi:hypothetical protein